LDKPFLHKRLSLLDASSELKLDNHSHGEAIKRLLQYAQYDGLKIHIYSEIIGYDVKKPLTQTIGPMGEDSHVMIDEDVSYIKSSDDSIIFTSGSYDINQDEPRYISVFTFLQNNIEYYSVNESEQFIYSTKIKEDNFHIYREDLQEFILSMKKDISLNDLKRANTIPTEEADSVIRALTLLAVSLAETSGTYKTGTKVNASRFKDHIIELAKKYKKSQHGLKSIDDKINKQLDHLDLKDLSKIK